MNGFIGNGDIGAHSGFVGVSGDLLDDSGGDAELEGNAYESAAGSVGSEELPFSVKSKFSTNNFKKIRIPQFSETRFGSFVGLFLVYKQ